MLLERSDDAGASANPPNPALPAGEGGGGASAAGAPAAGSSGALLGGASFVDAGALDAGEAGVAGVAGVAGGAGKPACESVSESIDDLRPTVTLLIDQSRSMNARFPNNGSPNTRWSLVGDALFDPSNGVVRKYESSTRFGASFYTSHSGYAGGACPLLSEVQAATQSYDALRTLYLGLRPDGDTPTGDAITAVAGQISATPSHSLQSIILVTDGNPDTCLQPMPDNGQPEAVAATEQAYSEGIDLYVLGISNDIAGQNVQQLANAGAGKPIDLVWGLDADAAQPFHVTGNGDALGAQLGEILSRIPFCEVRFSRDVAESELDTAQVLVDGKPLAHSSMDGFTLKDPRRLQIVGNACTAIQSGAKLLVVRVSCD